MKFEVPPANTMYEWIQKKLQFSFYEITRLTLKIIVFASFLVCFYCEFITYCILPLTWTEQPNCPQPYCKKLLLVSDPQIIGSEWKKFVLLDVLAIWDSDRYLRRTFQKAVNFLKPDIIIFLGDLTDQGHIATDPEFESYLKRLQSVFVLPNSLKRARLIVIPGDNDVGGIEDILVPANVERFSRKFNETEECILIESIEFCKANLMTSVMQQSKFIGSDIVRVALSHVPLTPKQSFFLKEVVKKIRPQLIFSGHLHTSSHYIANEHDVWTFKHSRITPKESNFKIYKFHEGFIHEIIVPTCSYRMGVYEMGFGAAFIDTKKQLLYYNVLWLPHRFNQIGIYLLIVLFVIILLLAMTWKRTARNKQINFRKTNKFYASFL